MIEELVIATHNKGKAREIAELLTPYIPKFVTAGDLNLLEPEETGATFEANALLKAHTAAKASNRPALADDSGLAVHVLGGDPGIYSARWAKIEGSPERDFNVAMQKVHDALGDAQDRSAEFVCVLALAWPDGRAETFRGTVAGNITWPARGDKGFGYDPIFVPDGYEQTFAEIDHAEKQSISHRANAFSLFTQWLALKKTA